MLLAKKHRFRTRIELHWCSRPVKQIHRDFGIKRTWWDKTHTYQVVHFSDGLRSRDGRRYFKVMREGQVLTLKHSLIGAKRAAEFHAQKNGLLV